MNNIHNSPTTSRRPAFTLFEILIVVTIIGIIGLAAAPMMSGRSGITLKTAASVLGSDIEFCQNDCVTHPNDLRQVLFDVINNKYWIAPASNTSVPISHPADHAPYQNDFHTGRNLALKGIRLLPIGSSNATTATLSFDIYGNNPSSTDTSILLTDGTRTYTVTFKAQTGDVAITDSGALNLNKYSAFLTANPIPQ